MKHESDHRDETRGARTREARRRWAVRLAACAAVLGFTGAAVAAPAGATTRPAGPAAVSAPAGLDALSLTPNATAAAPSGPSPAAAGDLTNLSLEDLMNVEVTSVAKRPQRVADAPAAISVITQEDIARSGLHTIPDLLRLAPGVDVARFSASQWAVSTRGFNDLFANHQLVLMDGRTLYTPSFSGVYWDAVDYVLQDLDRIEVIRGPGATLWGSNAVNGVINITTKSAEQTQGWLVSGLGSTDENELSARYGGKIDDNTFYRVYGKGRYFDDFPATSGEADDHWQSYRGGFRIDRAAGANDAFTLQGDVYAERLNQTDRIYTLAPPFAVSERDAPTADGGNVLARWTHTDSPKSGFSLQFYYDRLDRYETVVGYQQDTFDVDFQHRFPLGQRQEVTWGAGYRVTIDRTHAGETISFDPASRTTQLASAFAQDEISLVPERLRLTLGTKLEWNSYTDFEVQPSVRLAYTPNEHNTFWGAVSRATRTPSRFEEDARADYTTFPLPTGGVGQALGVGNRALDSEELLAFELGYRTAPVRGVTVDVSGFYNSYDKLIGVTPGAPVLNFMSAPNLLVPTRFDNNMDGEVYGGEVSVTWNVNADWRLLGSYSLAHTQLRGEPGADPARLEFFQRASPQHQAQLRSYLNLTRNLELNAAAYYVSELESGAIPAYVRFDVALVWRPADNLTVSVGVQNLFDNGHPEFSGSNTYELPSEEPRTVYGQVTLRF